VTIANDWRFQRFGLVFMTVVAIWPQQVIRIASGGKVKQIDRTGVVVLRLIGTLSALSFLYDLGWAAHSWFMADKCLDAGGSWRADGVCVGIKS
jgi:hypothetical protein